MIPRAEAAEILVTCGHIFCNTFYAPMGDLRETSMTSPLNGEQMILHVVTSVGAVCEILATQYCALLTSVTGACIEIFATTRLVFFNSLHGWQDQTELKVTCVVSKSCTVVIL